MQSLCPRCKKDARHIFTARDFNRRVSDAQFHYSKCPDCRLIFLSNAPDDPDAYYGDSYYSPPAFEKLKKVASAESYQLRMITDHVRSGDLLEVGPGFGVFAYQAKSAGFTVDVIEKEQRCCDYLSGTVGVNAIHSASPQDVISCGKRYDVIALWHVIEHLPRPWDFLTKAAANLKRNGVLLVATPSPDAFQFEFQGARWPHVDAPRHTELIPSELLIKHMAACGLELAMITFDDKGARSWNRFGWQRYLMNLSRNKFIQQCAFVIGYFAALLMAFFDRRRGKGSAYTAVFRKVPGNEPR
ncbi:MAG: class I SAM-dependent methyltransferase [Candidatus Omnitrophota bacterium]